MGISDLNLSNIDINKHKIIIPLGTKIYKFTPKEKDPLKPTGKESRFVSEPEGFSMEKYSREWDGGNAMCAGTGGCYFSETISLAALEAGNTENKYAYEITLKSDTELIDLDSIANAEGLGKPYISDQWLPIYDEFYGKCDEKCIGVYCESVKNPKLHNFVLFLDKSPEFRNRIDKKLLKLNDDKY